VVKKAINAINEIESIKKVRRRVGRDACFLLLFYLSLNLQPIAAPALPFFSFFSNDSVKLPFS